MPTKLPLRSFKVGDLVVYKHTNIECLRDKIGTIIELIIYKAVVFFPDINMTYALYKDNLKLETPVELRIEASHKDALEALKHSTSSERVYSYFFR
jgi:hypothetical protein